MGQPEGVDVARQAVTPYFTDGDVTLWHGDALTVLRDLPDGSVDSCVTSPPYFGLRDYGVEGQMGAEASPAEYVENMRALFTEVRRVLADDGTLWLNLGDSYVHKKASGPQGVVGERASRTFTASGSGGYAGLPEKNLLGIPWRVAFALQDDGWILRNSIIWHKPNAMPESVTDRLSTRHENVFLFSKSRRYWFDLDPVREAHTSDLPPGYSKTYGEWVRTTDGNHNRTGVQGLHVNGKNPGDVWSIPTQPFPGAHFAVFPLAIPERCILAGCKPGGTVLDPFSGSGTTGLAAAKHGRKYVGIDLNAEYLKLSLETRLQQATLDFGESA
jgi:DNA modification methylase